MMLLAIDPATKCGWATDEDYGVWDLTLRKDESNGMKWLRLRAKLREVHRLDPIDVIAYERPAGRHMGAVIHHSKLIGVIEEFAINNGIEYMGLSASEIKKHATGKGNAGKPAMIAAAQDKLGYDGDDDNIADAMWIHDLAVSMLS